tara:strand:- start:655 stop:858 length:204 start_codon:yes stop_codon:yes gene_type:complete
MIEKAKKDETNAKIDVKKIVAPMLIYFITSNFGHLEIISMLVPEQNKKNFSNKLNFFIISNAQQLVI